MHSLIINERVRLKSNISESSSRITFVAKVHLLGGGNMNRQAFKKKQIFILTGFICFLLLVPFLSMSHAISFDYPLCDSEVATRPEAKLCDVEEKLDGAGSCPQDIFKASTVVCNPGSGDICDSDETCTNSSADCPQDRFQPQTKVFLAGSGDPYDPDERCTGNAGEACPAEAYEYDETECDDGNLCTFDDIFTSGVCSGTPYACNGHGTCLGDGTCECDSGWNGDKCDTAICSPACVNGSCTMPDTCSCDSGWYGDVCDSAGETIVVTTTTDELGSGEDCSLREAIQAANTNAAYGGCSTGGGTEIIIIPAGTYMLTRYGKGEDSNATGDLDIRNSMTLVGDDEGGTIIDGGYGTIGSPDRVFHVVYSSYEVVFQHLTIQNGRLNGTNDAGGGILNQGELTLQSCIVENNYAYFGGGGLYGSDYYAIPSSTYIEDCRFEGNATHGYGGALGITYSSDAYVTSSFFTSNTATNGAGAIHNYTGSLEIETSSFVQNTAPNGGAILSNGSHAYVVNTTFSGNEATYRGGAFYGASANGVKLAMVTISDNYSEILGGGLYLSGGSATLHGCLISGNRATSGPDVYGTLTAVSDYNLVSDTSNASGLDCATLHNVCDLATANLTSLDTSADLPFFGLLPSSPALDAGDCLDYNGNPVATDQRGRTRPFPVLGHCDIGAVENGFAYGDDCDSDSDCDGIGICTDNVCCPLCTDNGSCSMDTGLCACDTGWAGVLCNICDEGYYGTDCESCPACSHGSCNDGNEGDGGCTCDVGWEGDLCDSAICDLTCIHGSCTAPDTCTCLEGYDGDTCEECAEGYNNYPDCVMDPCYDADCSEFDRDCTEGVCIDNGDGTHRCEANPINVGLDCGDGPTECSGQDTCDGSGTCQPNDFDTSTMCGDAGTECVNQDYCDGSGSCADHGFVAVNTACGNSPTECSGQDTCDGSGTCQTNDFDTSTTCGDDGTECVNQDYCDGSGSCADHGFVAANTACGNSPTECSGQDTCDGAGTCQPNDFDTSTTCGDDGTECVNQDYCDGSGSCADHGFVAVNTACGNSPTECSGQDTCNGAGTCQTNDFDTSTTCGDDGNECTNQDYCDGSGSCADNGFAENGTECDDNNPDTSNDQCLDGICLGETCTCAEVNSCCDGCFIINNGESCTSDNLDCTTDICDAGVCTHLLVADVCLIDNLCIDTGALNSDNDCESCQPDQRTDAWSFVVQDTPCGEDPTDCSGQDICDGLGSCQPNHLAENTPCDDSDLCTYSDQCDGEGYCNGIQHLCEPGICEVESNCDGMGGCEMVYSDNGVYCDVAEEGQERCYDGQCVSINDGEVCDMPIQLQVDSPENFTTDGMINVFTPDEPCSEEALFGPDIFFEVDLQPGIYWITVDPEDTADLAIVLIDSCDPISCTYSLNGAGLGEMESYGPIVVNGDRNESTALFSIDSVSYETAGSFEILVEKEAIVDGDEDLDLEPEQDAEFEDDLDSEDDLDLDDDFDLDENLDEPTEADVHESSPDGDIEEDRDNTPDGDPNNEDIADLDDEASVFGGGGGCHTTENVGVLLLGLLLCFVWIYRRQWR